MRVSVGGLPVYAGDCPKAVPVWVWATDGWAYWTDCHRCHRTRYNGEPVVVALPPGRIAPPQAEGLGWPDTTEPPRNGVLIARRDLVPLFRWAREEMTLEAASRARVRMPRTKPRPRRYLDVATGRPVGATEGATEGLPACPLHGFTHRNASIRGVDLGYLQEALRHVLEGGPGNALVRVHWCARALALTSHDGQRQALIGGARL